MNVFKNYLRVSLKLKWLKKLKLSYNIFSIMKVFMFKKNHVNKCV